MLTVAVKRDDNYTLKIIHDEDSQSPRDWDNLSKMVCFHNRYNFGDKHDFKNPQRFIADFVSANIPAKDIIAYVKDGKSGEMKLEYDKSELEWELKTYDSYFKKWYTEHTADAPLDNRLQSKCRLCSSVDISYKNN